MFLSRYTRYFLPVCHHSCAPANDVEYIMGIDKSETTTQLIWGHQHSKGRQLTRRFEFWYALSTIFRLILAKREWEYEYEGFQMTKNGKRICSQEKRLLVQTEQTEKRCTWADGRETGVPSCIKPLQHTSPGTVALCGKEIIHI